MSTAGSLRPSFARATVSASVHAWNSNWIARDAVGGHRDVVLLALPTCSNLPDWEIDDRPLHEALGRRGVPFEQPVWDDGAVDWSRFDAVLIRTTWDYSVKLPAYLEWVRRVSEQSRLFNPAGVVRWNAHKRYLRELEQWGVPLAPTVWLPRGGVADLAALVAERLGPLGAREGFLKPCVGATARETLRFALDDEGVAAAQAHVDRLLPGEDLMLQPFLASVCERGEWSAVFVDGRITHCVRKVPVPGDYRVQDDFGASDGPYEPTPVERAAACRAVEVASKHLEEAGVGPLLYARTDWLWQDDGTCVLTELELVEPSLFFRHGSDAADALADALLARL